MTNLNLKGIWIPIEILEDDKLSDKEKIIYSIIIFLSKDKKYCYCTNNGKWGRFRFPREKISLKV